jgi:hypothetical protein
MESLRLASVLLRFEPNISEIQVPGINAKPACSVYQSNIEMQLKYYYLIAL